MLLLHQGGRQGAGRSGFVEQRAYLPSRASISKCVHSEAVHLYKGYFETYILPIIFFMYLQVWQSLQWERQKSWESGWWGWREPQEGQSGLGGSQLRQRTKGPLHLLLSNGHIVIILIIKHYHLIMLVVKCSMVETIPMVIQIIGHTCWQVGKE